MGVSPMPWAWARRPWYVWVICGVLAGCHGTAAQGPQPYVGPTLAMSEVVQHINANNRKISSLWTTMDLDAHIVDEHGKVDNEVLSGNLLYRPRRDLLLVAYKDPVGRVLELGSNQDLYWMSIKVGPDTAWWGHYANLGKPCSQPIPIRPDLIVQVLGVSVIPPDFAKLPAPVMRFNNDFDAYMFDWITQAPGRWVALKEVWYDRKTFLPRLVLLFDQKGRVVLRAYLSNHRKVKDDNLPENQWPMVATTYRLYFPDSGSTLSLHLTDIALHGPHGVPNDRSFRFDPERTGTSKVVQLDEGCGP